MTSEISIIIPACNEEKYIENALLSIRQQNFSEHETIIICNGCTDHTEAIAKKFENENTQVISFKEANVSKARNIGAQRANGAILLFLDADSLLGPEVLPKIKENFTSEHSVATTKVRPDSPEFKYNMAMAFKNFYNSTGIYQGCSGALICKKEDFDRVDGYNANLKVKEHRNLIIKLKRHTGKGFTCIDTYITTSMRRFKQWGLTKAAMFWIKQWVKNYLGDLSKSEYEKIR